MRVNRWIVACGAAALVLASAAIGADGGGTLSACAKTESGQLRLDTGDGCRPSEHAVALGNGAASRADERYYVAPNLRDPSTFLPLGGGANPTPVVTSHVPAGDYAIAAQMTFNGTGGSGDVPCILVEPSGRTHGYAEESYDSPEFNHTMTIDGALSLAADTDISLVCWNIPFSGGSASVRAADITTKTVDAASITQETH